MEVQLLGEVAVVGERGDCPIAAPLARRCLGALALSPGSLSIDGLAEALWGDDLPANWKQGLRNVVAKLRIRFEVIGGGGAAIITTTPAGYRLAPECAVDVYLALGDADAADEAWAAGEPDRALELAASALVRLERPLLPDIDGAWLIGYRTRLSWARTRSLQVAAAASRDTGRAAQAVDLATRAVLADPLAEESHRQLMHAHAVAGDRAAALRAYETCRRTLAAELGIAPDQVTTDLHLTLLGTEEPHPARPRVAGPFLGRDRELATLRDEVAGGALVSIVGPGGIGKSRLAAMFAADTANGFDGSSVELDVEGQGHGSDLTILLATALGVTAGTADVLNAVLDELARRGRSLLVLDGVDQVADEAAGLIAAVTTRSPTTAVVVTCRVPLGLDIEFLVRPAPLDPAGAGHACFVAYAATAGASFAADESTRAAVVDVCRAVGGIPLGIELAARQVTQVSLADLADRLQASNLDDEGRAAELVDAVVDSTLALLDDIELEVFLRLSVMGGPADLALVEAAVADDTVPARRVVRVLAQLAERALVRLDRTALRWRYDQHPLLRAAADARLTSAERQQAYGRMTTALFARLPPSAMATPRLGDIDPLMPAVRRVLAAALSGDADVSTALRMAYWLHRYWAARAVDEGIRWLDRLLAAAPDDDPYRGPGEVALGYLLHWSGRPDAGVEHLLVATSRLDAGDPLLAFAHFLIANAAENRQPDVARRHLTIAISVASAAGREDVATRCRLGLAVVEFEAGERDAGLDRYESALRDVEAGGDDDTVAVHLPQYASMLVSLSRFDDAHGVLQRVERQLADDVRITAMHTAAVRARLERHRARPSVARRHARRAAEMIDRAGVGRLEGLVSPTVALLDLADGRPHAATTELARGAKAANASEQVAILADIVDAAILVAMATGHTADALDLKGCVDTMRLEAQVQRGQPEQVELDAVLAGLVVSLPHAPSDLHRSRVVDLIVGLAGD